MKRIMITRRDQVGAASLVTGLFMLLLAAMFVMFFANTARAGAMQGAEQGTIQGEVIAVSNVNHIETITLRSSQIGSFPNDDLNIFLNNTTKIRICNTREPSKDLRVGRNATVTYRELGGVPVARTISERC